MALVLGIDAAWTETGSSGVALLRVADGTSRIIACASSYARFIADSGGSEAGGRDGHEGAAKAARLLAAAEALGRAPVDIVAIDMPIARRPFAGRREADQAISRAFGAAWAGTHSPTPMRPGAHGRRLAEGFQLAGCPLATQGCAGLKPALIEVHPLAALVRLLRLARRPPYKVARSARYWPALSPDARIDRLLEQWTRILAALRQQGCELGFSAPAREAVTTLVALKPFEDILDAAICAWVGALYLRGDAEAFGNAEAAIWVPKVTLGEEPTPH